MKALLSITSMRLDCFSAIVDGRYYNGIVTIILCNDEVSLGVAWSVSILVLNCESTG